mmetsp:Transcript_14426/g.31060  ORF Transcript_14426/g.31060 Transcript_14426/m.31060 type:complete len:84 (-) Transcript_14426:158-409(-)
MEASSAAELKRGGPPPSEALAREGARDRTEAAPLALADPPPPLLLLDLASLTRLFRSERRPDLDMMDDCVACDGVCDVYAVCN